MRDVAFLLAFAAMLLPAVRFGHVGTMLWTWVALISPNYYMYGIARGLPLNKVTVAVAAISLFLDKTRANFKVDTHVRLMIAFLILSLISYMFALSDKARVDTLADKLTKEVVLCLFMVAVVRDRLRIHSVLLAMAMGMSIHGAIEGAKYISAGGGHVLAGPSTIGDNNAFGLAMLMVLPILLYLYRYSVASVVRLALAGAMAVNIVSVIGSNSRGALIGMAAVGFTMFLRSKSKLLIAIAFIVIAGATLSLAPERYLGRMSTIGNAEADGSFLGRVNSWKLHLLVALDRPLIGGGFSPMEDGRVWESYLPGLSALDFIPTGRPVGPLAAHSIYFEVLGDLGFTGLFLFLGMMFCAFRNMRIVLRLARGDPALEWAVDLMDMLRLSMVAYCVSGAALSMAYFELYYVMITLISLTRHHIEDLAVEQVPEGIAVLRGRPTRLDQLAPGLGRPIAGGVMPRR